jgi:toxin HigB-1
LWRPVPCLPPSLAGLKLLDRISIGYTVPEMIRRVDLSSLSLKQLRKAPKYISAKLFAWVDAVAVQGIEEVRKIPGYNDHPLRGDLAGKRAIRLSLQWRAVYAIHRDGSLEFISIEEVHPHDY